MATLETIEACPGLPRFFLSGAPKHQRLAEMRRIETIRVGRRARPVPGCGDVLPRGPQTAQRWPPSASAGFPQARFPTAPVAYAPARAQYPALSSAGTCDTVEIAIRYIHR